MKKIILLSLSALILTSCGIRTMSRLAEKSTNLFLKGVESTLKGMDWVYEKANGKINEDKIDGKWKIIGLYKGSFEEFKEEKNPTNLYKEDCDYFFIVDTKNKTFYQSDCNQTSEKTNYQLSFDKKIDTEQYANIFKFGEGESFDIINATNKNMVLEGYFIRDHDTHIKGIYLLEKVR